MSVVLGAQPDDLTVRLWRDADFVQTITSTSGPWPNGQIIQLRIAGMVWSASISGATGLWNVDKADVNALLALKPTKAQLFGILGDVDLLWATGTVHYT